MRTVTDQGGNSDRSAAQGPNRSGGLIAGLPSYNGGGHRTFDEFAPLFHVIAPRSEARARVSTALTFVDCRLWVLTSLAFELAGASLIEHHLALLLTPNACNTECGSTVSRTTSMENGIASAQSTCCWTRGVDRVFRDPPII